MRRTARKATLALALCARLAFAQDAGASDAGAGGASPSIRFDDAIYALCPDAPKAEPVDGGWFLPELRERRVACLMNTCEADRSRRAQEMAGAAPPPSWVWWAVGVVAAGGIGFAVGKLIK